MEEPEENMSKEDVRESDSSSAVKKPKKRSLVERELETNLTTRVTSPAIIADALSTSRYGRARRLKTECEFIESQKTMLAAIKSPGKNNTPVKVQSPVYRMHASNSPHKAETPKKTETYLDNQIDSIYQENISLSRFSDDTSSPSPAKKFPKVYIRKDLIQKREADETIMLIKNLFSPTNSTMKPNNLRTNNMEYSSEKNNLKQNGQMDNASVVKTLNFDGNNKQKKVIKDQKSIVSKNELFELEAKCPYQVGDLAWARMGTFPFWPCIVTRDPYSELFVKKKLFGRVEHDIIHVTFLGDNGRRSWIVDNMLRNYSGRLEFEATRTKFTPEDRKRDSRLYAAFFISEKKQALWNISVEEAESLLREPKRLRIDIFNDMLLKYRASKKVQKSGKITRTDSDVSLSESLYDSLFSEEDVKTDDTERSKNRSRNKSFDVSEVVTACLDNMAAKTGITKIQRQSHMDRWLQKAKSNTPEKTQTKPTLAVLKMEKPDIPQTVAPTKPTKKGSNIKVEKSDTSQTKLPVVPVKLNRKGSTSDQKKSTVLSQRPYRFRRSHESQPKFTQKACDTSNNDSNEDTIMVEDTSNNTTKSVDSNSVNCGLGFITKVESLADIEDVPQNTITTIISIADDDNNIIQPTNDLIIEKTKKTIQHDSEVTDTVEEVIKDTLTVNLDEEKNSDDFIDQIEKPSGENSNVSILMNRNTFDDPKTKDISAMEIVEGTKSVEKFVQDKNEACDAIVSAIEVDDDTPLDNKVDEESSRSKSEIVSNESVKDNKVQLNDINCIIKSDPLTKEAQNVTIEASVTETKNEDTLNSQAEGGQQESNYKPKSYENVEKNESNVTFLEVSNSHSSNMVKKVYETLCSQKYLTPDRQKNCDKINITVEKSNNNASLKSEVENHVLNSYESNFFHEEIKAYKIDSLNSKSSEKFKKCDKIETASQNSLFRSELENHVINIDGDLLKEEKKTLGAKNSITPEKPKKYSNVETAVAKSKEVALEMLDEENQVVMDEANSIDKPNDISTEKVGVENQITSTNKTDFFHNSQEVNVMKESFKENKCIYESIHPDDLAMNDTDDELNKSGISESILQTSDEIDDTAGVGCHTFPLTSFEECNKSESLLKNNEYNLRTEKNGSVVDSVMDKLENDAESNSDPKEYDCNTRQNVESPTFTQLLDSEEFFRDVIETCDGVNNHGQLSNEKTIDHCETKKEVEHKTRLPETNNAGICQLEEDEVTSEDEPSPEYESFDEDTTEDFRKHMMSIESNITDKKDEELIVKICNEIAEKAKLSPTKYTNNVEVAKPTAKLDTSSKPQFCTESEIKPSIRPKNKLVTNLEDKFDTDSIDKNDLRQDYKLDTGKEKPVTRSEIKLNIGPQEKLDTRLENIIDTSKDKQDKISEDKLETVDTIEKLDTKLQNIINTSTDKQETILENKLETVDTIEKLDTKLQKVINTSTDKQETILENELERVDTIEKLDTKLVNTINTTKDTSLKNKFLIDTIDELDTSRGNKLEKGTTDKFNTSSISDHDTRPKGKLETKLENKLHTSNDGFGRNIENKLDTGTNDELDINIEKQSKPLCPEVPTQEKRKTKRDKLKVCAINTYNVSEINDMNTIHCDNSDLVLVNGDAVMEEISEKSKRIYKTRLSVNSITKETSSPDVKIYSSTVKDIRKSFEYDPKVVIIRLETDKIGSLKTLHNQTKSATDKNKSKNDKYNLSLKRYSSNIKHTESKSIDNLEPKIKSEKTTDFKPTLITKEEDTVTLNKRPKKINIENGALETNIPESIKGTNHRNNDRQLIYKPDLLDDTDFDIDTVSLNSEDSEISLPNSIETLPKRNLRSRPLAETTLESALKNPEFLKYLELRQDYLMDEHSELNEEEVISYVYKTWQYEEELKSNCKKIDAHHLSLVKGVKQETPSRKKSKTSHPKNNIENYFQEKYEQCRKTFDFHSETGSATTDSCEFISKNKMSQSVDSAVENCNEKTEEVVLIEKTPSKSSNSVDLTFESSDDVLLVKDKYKDLETVSVKSEESSTPKETQCSEVISLEKKNYVVEDKSPTVKKVKEEREFDSESIGSEDSEIPLRQLRSKVSKENKTCLQDTPEKIEPSSEIKDSMLETEVKEEADDATSTVSDNEPLQKQKKKRGEKRSLEDPEFIKYLELKQDALMDENPQLSQDEIVSYLYKTWLYEESSKSDFKKNDELEQANLVKGLNYETTPSKKVKRRPKVGKRIEDLEVVPKEKPKRKIIQPYYNENFSDIEDELEVFEIFKTKKAPITIVTKAETDNDKVKSPDLKMKSVESLKLAPKTEEIDIIEHAPVQTNEEIGEIDEVEYIDEIEKIFTDLIKPKPNVFKGLMREKVCDICELAGNLVKCKGCNGMFHPDCVKRETEAIIEIESLPLRGRKKKRKLVRKPKSLEDSGSHSDEKSHDASADVSIEDIIPPEICTFDADVFETQLAPKMKELLDAADTNYDSYSSDDGIDWKNTVAGKCEIVDVKLKRRNAPIDYSDFKCNLCQRHDVPVCFVCKLAVSKTNVKMRQKCHVAHCHKYYHLECLDHWPQTQFNSGEPSRNNKKIYEFFEALTCPRHVCHTCVSDDPRGCKTRFSGDKLAKCVRCPATYHSFNKCLPAGSQILTASHIICPRHSDPRAAKIPCHVNTGWCFICALGGSLICCEYCPTSFHAECLNIKPPEGNYMCEDCETGRLPLYGEMVWVKLGHYRWWPAQILHPSDIPENIMAVKHGLGDFVVRFFGQYDHYWVNRGRVFPYQEGDSGRISSQKSKIDADFTLAIEHAQRAYAILKNAEPNEEESLDIASSLLPPHYVKLKCNKPCGSLCGRKVEDPSNSLTQCECNPDEPDPCGLYSQCLNRMLLTECGPTCRAGDRCNNRAFEKRLYPKLVPYRTPHRGWGLKTLEGIKAGQFIIEYVGELIDEEEFRRRMRRKHEIRDENFYFLTLDKERMIDAGPKGNAARFMNHCCEPNCETQKWTVLGDVRVGLFAIDDIPANSEVTFNYNLECAGIEKKRCLCGAKRCSGYIGAKPKQGESQTKKSKDGKLAGKRTYKKKKQEESPSTSKNKPKKPVGRPPKPKELTEIEKDLLIIKSATSISSDDSSRSQSVDGKNPKTLKRKRVSISTEEVPMCNGHEPSVKKQKCEEKPSEVGD